jgi:hypothetical protein
MRRLVGVAILACLLLAAGVPAGHAVGQPNGARPGAVRGTTWLLRNSLSGGAAEVQFDFGLAGDQKLMGDWNGDGTRTPGVFRNGTWYLRDRNGAGGRYISFPFGAAGALWRPLEWLATAPHGTAQTRYYDLNEYAQSHRPRDLRQRRRISWCSWGPSLMACMFSELESTQHRAIGPMPASPLATTLTTQFVMTLWG